MRAFSLTISHNHDNIVAASVGTDLHYLPIGINLAIDDNPPVGHPITIECYKDLDRNNDYKLKPLIGHLDPDNDPDMDFTFSPPPADNTTGASEARYLTFHKHILIKKNGQYRDHQKVLIIVSIPDTGADNGREDCFQTVTVYDKSAFSHQLQKTTKHTKHYRHQISKEAHSKS